MNPQDIKRGLHFFQQARLLREAGRLGEAVGVYARAEQLMPANGTLRQEHAQARLQHAQQCLQQGDFVRALDSAGRAAAALPGHRGAQALLGLCLKLAGRRDEALAVADRLLAAAPGADAMALRLACLLETGHVEALDAAVGQARAQYPDDPQVRHLCAEHLLRAGDYARGFADAEFLRPPGSRARHPLSALPCPDWDGTPFAGTLLVGGEQGLGDQVLASSVFGDLVAAGQQAVIGCDARLLPLFSRSFPALRFVPQDGTELAAVAAAPAECRKLLLSDLPGRFRRQAADFPTRRSWLRADSERSQALRADYRERFGTRLRIGLAWASHRAFLGGSKSLPLRALAPLLANPRHACINLQHGPAGDDLAALGPLAAQLYRDPQVDALQDIDGLCAQLAALDQVVTCSNSTAHLAAALGVPTTVLLPHAWPVLWYWGYRGERTPWYPAVQLQRCGPDDDWSVPVQRVAATLRP